MMHNGRIFSVLPLGSIQAAVELISRGKMPLCRGIYCPGLLFLNDSDSEEGERRFAVMKADRLPAPGRCELEQFGSINFTILKEDEIFAKIDSLRSAESTSLVVVRLDGPNHCCPLCG